MIRERSPSRRSSSTRNGTPIFQAHMAEAYFAKLTGAPYKRFVELGEGTHTVMLEKNRMQFFHEILGFLDESDATALK